MIEIAMRRRGQVGLVKELGKLLRFLDASVLDVTVVDDMTIGVTLSPEAPAEFVAKIPEIVDDYMRGYKDFRPKVFATSEHKVAVCSCPHEADNFEIAHGVRSKAGDVYELQRFLIATWNRLFRELRPHRMAAPSMISRHLVEKMGYFGKFPNLANFVVNFKKDYQLFKNVTSSTLEPRRLLEYVDVSDKMLNPVPCYHIYPQANRLLERSGHTVFTIDGSAYRFESHNMSRTRLNEFHMHEIVFFGDKAGVERMRETVMTRLMERLNRWQVDFEAETSSDVFYSNDAGVYMATQRFEQAKIEINGKTDSGYHSFVSGNLHGTHYTKLFDIKVPGCEEPHSGCVGWGLERVIDVLLCQFGDDPKAWPDSLRKEFMEFLEVGG